MPRFGHLTIKKNLVVKFKEKDILSEGWINGGFFVLNKNIFQYLDDKKIAFKVKNQNNLYNRLNYLLDNTKKSSKNKNKLKIIGDKVLNKSVKEIEGFI